MLDPGRYLAEAIYFLQYTLAQILWAVDRALLSIAVLAESLNSWVTGNVGYFVQLLTNALSAPLGGMFILALTALGFWYALNNVVATERWVDPSKLFTYGLIAFFFFSSPIVVIDLMEELRQALNAGVDPLLIEGAAGDVFDTAMDGTDTGLGGAVPDVNGDGVIASFDLVAAFMAVGNIDELDSSEFPVDFEATYFPFGDPSGIDLGDEADQELAKAQASQGIQRLLFALIAIPTAVAEHFLRLALTAVAMLLYLGVPLAMLFAFFIYTQAFLGAYLRQFVNLLIETLLSVIIAGIMITLLAAAALEGVGLFIAASVIASIVLLWRIRSALALASAAFDLFGGAMLTGGRGGMDMARMGTQAAAGAVALTGAALTGGATVAAGAAIGGAAAALRADGRADGRYLGTDPAKTDGRVRQLRTMAGYTLGRAEPLRRVIEGAHEVRTLTRNLRDGQVQPHAPDALDYLRTGASMSGFGSSPWLAMRLSPSLRAAYDEIGGRHFGYELLNASFDEGAPVTLPADGDGARSGSGNGNWRDLPPTERQLTALELANVRVPEELTRGQASDLLSAVMGRNGDDRAATARGGTDPLLDRLGSLEQALATLTAALTGDNPPSAAAAAGENGPGATSAAGGVQDVRLVSVDPDVDEDGLADSAQRGTTAAASAPPAFIPPAGAGAVALEPWNESRARALETTLAQLAAPSSVAGQAAARSLAAHAGSENTARLQAAVSAYSPAFVNAAARDVAALAARYRAAGRDEQAILTAFQDGTAAAELRADGDLPLADAELAAVADTVLLPRRRLARRELAAAIGRRAQAGATTVEEIAAAIGSPVGFGGQTGTVRGVLAGATALELTPEDLTRLADLLQAARRADAEALLADRGASRPARESFLNDLATLPAALVVPQSAANPPATAPAANPPATAPAANAGTATEEQ